MLVQQLEVASFRKMKLCNATYVNIPTRILSREKKYRGAYSTCMLFFVNICHAQHTYFFFKLPLKYFVKSNTTQFEFSFKSALISLIFMLRYQEKKEEI